MSLLRHTLYGLSAGLIAAGAVHIGAILLAPTLAVRYEISPFPVPQPGDILRLPTSGEDVAFEPASPVLQAVACGFSLQDNAVIIAAEGSVPYWAVTIYDGEGHVTYSFNDRIAENGSFEVTLGTQEQRAALASQSMQDETTTQDPAALSPAPTTPPVPKPVPRPIRQTPVVAISEASSFAVLRAYVPDESWASDARTLLGSLSCTPLPVAPSVSETDEPAS